MASEGDPLRAQNEALFLIRRWLPQGRGLPVDLGVAMFTPHHGAALERAYGERLQSWLQDPAYAGKYGMSVETINEYLRTDPAIAARFSRPWDGSMGISEEQAVKNGMALKDAEGKPLRNEAGALIVRTFFAVDADGYIYQTLPGGTPLTPPGKLGTIQGGPGKDAIFPQLITEIAGRQIQKSLGIGDPAFFKTLQSLDGILDLQARKDILGENNQNVLEAPESGLRLYKTLGAMPEDVQRQTLAGLVAEENPLPAAPAGEAAARETPEQTMQRQKTRAEKEQQNVESVERYIRLIQTLKGLDDSALRDVLTVNDSRRMEGLISRGAIRPGLSLGAPLPYDAPWRPDPGLDQGRMWDMAGFGGVYQRLTGDIYNDLRVTARFTIGRDELLNNVKDEGFKQILGKMALPEVVDIQQFNKISTVLYAYQVLKHEKAPQKLDDGALERLSALYKGAGGGLSAEERQAVVNSLNGHHVSGKPPFVVNSKWDLPLMQYNGKVGESPQQQNIASQAHLKWFEQGLNAPLSVPGFEGVKSTITGDQAARLFWSLDAGAVAGFPREKLDRPVSRADRAKIEQGGGHVEPGTRYDALGLKETLALFSQDENKHAAVLVSLKETLQNETAARFWSRRGFDAEHAQIYKAHMKVYIQDGLANGYVSAPAPPQPAAAGQPAPGTQNIGGALRPPEDNAPAPVVVPGARP